MMSNIKQSFTMSRQSIVITSILLLGSCIPTVHGQDDDAPAVASSGILPIPDYSGDVAERGFLLGNFGDNRASLAEQGIQYYVDWTQHLQGVVDGGRDTTTRYGGSLDYVLSLDLDRAGVMPGALITMRGESRYGNSVNSAARSVLPVNTDFAFPLTDDDLAFTLTELTYTQFLSETFGLFMGKLNTFGGDPNEFAHGRGKFQFSNADLIFNPVTALTVPYSTLGIGAVWIPSPEFTLLGTLMNSADSPTTTGFDDFGDGWTLSVEAQLRHELGGLPGGQNFGLIYANDGNFLRLTGKFNFAPDIGLSVESTQESYALYWSGWQYLWAEESDETPIDTLNGIPDRKGFGLFARAGFGDDDTLPIEWHISGGIGGRGLFPNRPDDHYGVGYSYSAIETKNLSSLVTIEDHAQGGEAFYSAALSAAAYMTFSVQVFEDINPSTDTAVLLGVRLNVRF